MKPRGPSLSVLESGGAREGAASPLLASSLSVYIGFDPQLEASRLGRE